MSEQLIPVELLEKTNKILFITHLALGDYSYLQNCFKAFAEKYPHIEIHLWIDEVRRTSDSSKWENLKKNVLYDWVESVPYFKNIYKETYSPQLYRLSIQQAQLEKYPLVVSFATLRPHRYAALARQISPDGFIVGIKNKVKLYSLHHLWQYKKLDIALPRNPVAEKKSGHISETYAIRCKQLFNIEIKPEERVPFVNVPIEYMGAAEEYLVKWGVDRICDKLVFINAFAKNRKRSWPLERAAELIIGMQKQAEWENAWFLINATPDEMEYGRAIIKQFALKRAKLFTADKSFFQLPAILSLCHLIISVDTSIMHLANAVHVPVIALMRNNNPEWVPLDAENSILIQTKKRNHWVEKISVEEVLNAVSEESSI